MRVALVLACALLAACSPERAEDAPRRGVLLVAIDGLRADHVACYGYDRATTPELDALARAGVRFDAAFSTAPAILQSNAALLTGCDPLVARRQLPPDVTGGALTFWSVPKAAPFLAQEFLRHGFATAAFVDHPQLGKAFGFARGFQEFQGLERGSSTAPEDICAEALFGRLERWLDERDEREPWFAYVHLGGLERVWWESDPAYDTYFQPRAGLDLVPPVGDAARLYHALPRARWSGGVRTLGEYEAEYDGALRRLDTALGRCVGELRAAGRLDSTTIVVVGTRGLSFGESGLVLDTGTLSDADLRVPLVIRPAAGARFAPGLATRSLASLIDVAPTLLQLAGIPVTSAMQGVSLVEALGDAQAVTRPYAFARCGYQSGWVVFGARYCLEMSEPWRAQDGVLVSSWYGGAPPERPAARVVLHDREADSAVGHAHSAALDPSLVEPMREAFQRWEAQVEQLRLRFQPLDWPGEAPKSP